MINIDKTEFDSILKHMKHEIEIAERSHDNFFGFSAIETVATCNEITISVISYITDRGLHVHYFKNET